MAPRTTPWDTFPISRRRAAPWPRQPTTMTSARNRWAWPRIPSTCAFDDNDLRIRPSLCKSDAAPSRVTSRGTAALPRNDRLDARVDRPGKLYDRRDSCMSLRRPVSCDQNAKGWGSCCHASLHTTASCCVPDFRAWSEDLFRRRLDVRRIHGRWGLERRSSRACLVVWPRLNHPAVNRHSSITAFQGS